MIQLAKAFNLIVIATCYNLDSSKSCSEFGADFVISRNTQNIVAAVMDFTKGSGVHAVIDCIGDGTTLDCLQVLAVEGRLIQLASSDSTAEVDLRTIIDKQVMFPLMMEQNGSLELALSRMRI
jgi:NADPH:quinone reductase